MSDTSFECEDSSQCVEEIDGVKIFKECYEEIFNSDRVFFCDCSNLFGFVGEKCDQETPMVNYNKAISLFFFFTTLPLILWISFRLFKFIKSASADTLEALGPRKKQQKRNSRTQAILVAVACICAIFLIFFHSCGYITATFNAESFGLAERRYFVGGEILFQVEAIPANFMDECLVLALCFFVVASVQISGSWIELAEKISFDRSEDALVWKERSRKFKIFARTFSFLYVSLSLIFLMTHYLLAVSVMSALIGFVLLVSFIYGRKVLMAQFDKMPTISSHSSQKAVHMVTISSKANIAILGIMLFSLLFHAVFELSVTYKLPPGSGNVSVILRDIAVMGGVILTAVNGWYINQIFAGLVDTSTNKKSRPAQGSLYVQSQSYDPTTTLISSDMIDSI